MSETPGPPARSTQPGRPEDPTPATGDDLQPASDPRGEESASVLVAGEEERRRSGDGLTGPQGPLMSLQERDTISQRLEQALAAFIDDPRGAVAEAQSVLDHASTRLTEELARQRENIGALWSGKPGEGDSSNAGMEELLSALRRYRDTVERVLRF